MDHELNYRINLRDGSFGVGMKDAINKTSELDSLMGKLGSTIAAAFTIGAAKQLIDETTEVATKMQGLDNIIKFASKGQQDFASNQSFINKTIEDFKLPMVEAREGYAGMLAAFKNTENGGELARQTFLGVSTAATVLHMSNQQVAMSTKALTDMMSKGTVQAEELKGQLGDAGIKDAIGTAARAMGKSIPELMAVMQKGELIAADFVPKFAAQLSKEYGPSMANAMEGFQAQTNASNNEIIKQQQLIGTQLIPVKLALLDVEAKTLQIVSAGINFYNEHSDAINAIAVGAGLAAATMGAYALATKASAIWTGIAGVATEVYYGFLIATEEGLGVVAAAQWALNAAMDANPIGIVVVGLGALAAGLAYAYNKFEGFRAVMDGVWQTMKDGMKIALGLGKVMIGAMTFDPAMMQEGMAQAAENTKKVLTGQSFKAGVKLSLEESAKDKKKKDEHQLPGTSMATGNVPALAGGGAATSRASLAGSGSGGSGSGGGKSITVTIQNLVKEINYNAIGGNINEQELERQMTSILVRAVRDFETTQ